MQVHAMPSESKRAPWLKGPSLEAHEEVGRDKQTAIEDHSENQEEEGRIDVSSMLWGRQIQASSQDSML